MERTLHFTFSASVILVAATAFPKIFFHDAKNVPQATIVRAKDAAYQYIFDNSIKPWLIMKLVVCDRKRETVFVDAYTLFGIKYATVTTVHNSRTGALICAGRFYDIWQPDANSILPCG